MQRRVSTKSSISQLECIFIFIIECLRKKDHKKFFHQARKRPDSFRHAFCYVCGERIAEKAYTASISQAASGKAASNFEFRHGAVAPINRLTDSLAQHNTIRQTAAQQQQQQRSSSTAAAAAAAAAAARTEVTVAMPRQMNCGTAARPGLARSPRSSPRQQNSQFFNNVFRSKRQRHQPQPQHNSPRTAAAAAVAAAAAAVRRGWRWRWRLRRRRCGIATVVDKISTEYITQQQRTRSHRRERGLAH